MPWTVVYFEAYTSLDQAIEREKQLKRFGSAYTALLKRLKLK
jgi:predicted GIY-YIG superfamily endonuclease